MVKLAAILKQIAEGGCMGDHEGRGRNNRQLHQQVPLS
jgi:hypothetical protein